MRKLYKWNRGFLGGFLLLVYCCFLPMLYVQAAPEENGSQALEACLDELDFTEIDREIKKLFPKEKIHFRDLLEDIFAGDMKAAFKTAGVMLHDQLFYELNVSRKSILQILSIALLAAVVTNFSGIVKNRQIAEIGFCMLYLLLITICLHSFKVMLNASSETVTELTAFIKVLGPVYFLVVSFSSGITTSLVFYQLLLGGIYIVEVLVLKLILPVIQVSFMMRILDRLSAEPYLSRFCELLELLVKWILRIMLTGIAGINLMQGILTPAMDSLKRGTLLRGIEMIPGIGDIA